MPESPFAGPCPTCPDMELLRSTNPAQPPSIGISAIATFQPEWVLPNEWYAEMMARKFVKHTGILARSIADQDEIALGLRSVEKLVRKTRLALKDCAGVIFVSPSFVPMSVARRLMDTGRARQEQLSRAARRFVADLGIRPRQVIGINSFCSGYARAMSLARNKLLSAVDLQRSEFLLVVTSSRISRITDFSCKQSGALFGDLATATLVSRCDSVKYPVHFELVDARFEKKPASRPYFDFSLRQQVLRPTVDGGRQYDSQRVVFSLDGMGIADVAPRAMASAATEMAAANGLQPTDVRFVIPHQAGSGIVRFTGIKLEQAGYTGELINGMTGQIGNVSSGSVPYTIDRMWHRLQGSILCPVAAVGAPGKNEVSQGCLLLRTTARHRAAAA